MLTHTYTRMHTNSEFLGITNTSNQLTNCLSGSGQDEILHIQDVTSLQNTAVPLWLIASETISVVDWIGIALVMKPFPYGHGSVDGADLNESRCDLQ